MRTYSQGQTQNQLTLERLRRGWTREYIAVQIGVADPKTIGRWERGVAVPSTFFRQKLCTLFEMLPQDLGLLPKKQASTSPEPVKLPLPEPSFTSHTLYDPAIPLSLIEGGLIGRKILSQHSHQFLCQDYSTCVAFYGLPGIGKTALAVQMTCDNAILEHFSDGVLWACVGKHPDIIALLTRWAQVLHLPEKIQQQCVSEEDWHHAIRMHIGSRRLLIVLDDLWSEQDARKLKVGGFRCSYLITTHIASLALQYANNHALPVPALNHEEGQQLLSRYLRACSTNDTYLTSHLVQITGGLPLALIAIGKYCQTQNYYRQPQKLHMLCAELSLAEKRLKLPIPSVLYEYHPATADEQRTLATVLRRSISYLTVEEYNAFERLSFLSSRIRSFSAQEAFSLCGISTDLLNKLVATGFLEVKEVGKYVLHQLIGDFFSWEAARSFQIPDRNDLHLLEAFRQERQNALVI